MGFFLSLGSLRAVCRFEFVYERRVFCIILGHLGLYEKYQFIFLAQPRILVQHLRIKTEICCKTDLEQILSPVTP